jgi:NAD(P)-dependent dehydrogenase (short-subunit alcohol dehydrogenase family)
MDLGLTGKVAIVTGGSRGIGKAIALALAVEGCEVAIVARDKAMLDVSRSELARRTGRAIQAISTDTGDDGAVKAMVAEVLATHGRIDILVNCAAQPAGQAKPPTVTEITTEDLWADVNVKVMGYLRTAREVAGPMAAGGGGRIINISGLAALSTGNIIGSIRNISVAALTKNLADELGPRGITAVCVHPGLTRTEKTPGVIEQRAAAQRVSAAEIQKQMDAVNLVG